MGTSKSAAEFSSKIVKMGRITQARAAQTVGKGALATKEIIIETAESRGVSRTSKIAGGKWGVRYDVRGFNNPSALVKIFGPFHLVDGPTKAHQIGPRRKGRRRTNKSAISFNGVARASAQHPGTRGKRIFPQAKVTAQRVVPRVMSQSIVSGWRDALK